jgi:hypothetical protein
VDQSADERRRLGTAFVVNDISRQHNLSILAILKPDPSNKCWRAVLGSPDGGVRCYICSGNRDRLAHPWTWGQFGPPCR